MNKTDEYSVSLANESLEKIKGVLKEYEKGNPQNTQIEVQSDITVNAQYSNIKLDVTVYHDWEVME